MADNLIFSLQPMPATICPKLRRFRELIAEEGAAKANTYLAPRQAEAIERWRSAPVNGGNDAFVRLAHDLNRIGMSHAEIDATLRQEAGHAESLQETGAASCDHCEDRPAGWRRNRQ
jgi:hypothetical protein